MSNHEQPRRLNTGSARGSGRTSTGSGAPTRRAVNTSGARNTYHAPKPAAPAAHKGAAGKGRGPKKKRGCGFYIFIALLLAVAIVLGAVYGVYQWLTNAVQPGDNSQSLSEAIKTAEEYKGDVVNVLVCGIDYEDGRAYSNDAQSNDGMTDMIMYVNFDVKNKKINMMQIPRDTYVGSVAGSTGKINAVALRNGGIASLAQLISEQLKLPIDYYVTIDMQSLKEIVDTFGGIEVYVPHDISYKGSFIPAGLQNLSGESAEFFVRCRYGEGYANSDIDRLNMQRYFYSGLLKRFRTATVADVVKLMPVVASYFETDMSGPTMVSLGLSLLKVDSGDIMMCQMPVFNGQPYNEQSVVVADAAAAADLLYTYFRTYGEQVPVEQLDLQVWHTASNVSTNPNIQYMGQIDAAGTGEE